MSKRKESKSARKSSRLQQSISFHIPAGDLDSTSEVITNPYVDLPPEVFALTYLASDETGNPESLEFLRELTKIKWKTYLAGYIFNFNYKAEQVSLLKRMLTDTVSAAFQSSQSDTSYYCEVTMPEFLNPTEKDNRGLAIELTGKTEREEKLFYQAYILSWCNPEAADGILLPILLCRGTEACITVMHGALSRMLMCDISKLVLTQDNFTSLSTFALIMLEANDNRECTFCYKISSDKLEVSVAVEHLLKLWKEIHKEDVVEVKLDEVILFHKALENFYESIYGIKFGMAHLYSIKANKCFSLTTDSKVWVSSTKIMHVVLKCLTHIAVQRLKVKKDHREVTMADESRLHYKVGPGRRN